MYAVTEGYSVTAPPIVFSNSRVPAVKDLIRPTAPASRKNRRWRAYHAVAAVALMAASSLAAQIVSIPLGVPKAPRPSPNANLLGAPADIAGAVAARGRRPVALSLDASNHPADVLEFLGLTRGVRALVVEPELGYFGEIIGAAAGPGGTVTELVPPGTMQNPATRAAMSDVISRAPSLSPLPASPATVRFAPSGFDFVLLYRAADRLASTPEARPAEIAAFIQKLFVAVRPGGIVGVVDDPSATDNGPNVATGGEAARFKREFARAGFILDSSGHLRGDEDGDAGSDTVPAAAASPGRFILKFRRPE